MCWSGRQSVLDSLYFPTIISEYRILDTIKTATDTSYVDSVTQAAWQLRDVFQPGMFLGQYDGPVVYGSNANQSLYMFNGSLVRYSGNNPGEWPAGNAFYLGYNDGDEIICLHPTDRYLLGFKNRSIWQIERTSFTTHNIVKFVSGIGCIAPNSVIDLPGGGYAFLSENGIYSFQSSLQSLYKESGGNLPGISDGVQAILDKWTITTKKGCHAWLTGDENNVVFSFPAVDTSLVYSLPTGKWTVWDFAFSQTTRYDTTYQTQIRPSSDVLGIVKAPDSSIYKFGGVKLDAGDTITATWKSGWLFRTTDYGGIYEWAVQKAANEDSSHYTVKFYGSDGDSLIDADTTVAYWIYDVLPGWSQYWQVYIQSKNDSLEIQNFDLWWKQTGRRERH